MEFDLSACMLNALQYSENPYERINRLARYSHMHDIGKLWRKILCLMHAEKHKKFYKNVVNYTG